MLSQLNAECRDFRPSFMTSHFNNCSGYTKEGGVDVEKVGGNEIAAVLEG